MLYYLRDYRLFICDETSCVRWMALNESKFDLIYYYSQSTYRHPYIK